LGEDAQRLEGAADPEPRDAVGRAARDLATGEADRPGGWPEHAAQHVDERGLAGAVGADEAAHLAGTDRQRHRVERGQAAEALGYVSAEQAGVSQDRKSTRLNS